MELTFNMLKRITGWGASSLLIGLPVDWVVWGVVEASGDVFTETVVEVVMDGRVGVVNANTFTVVVVTAPSARNRIER